jgi:hypothetical protein
MILRLRTPAAQPGMSLTPLASAHKLLSARSRTVVKVSFMPSVRYSCPLPRLAFGILVPSLVLLSAEVEAAGEIVVNNTRSASDLAYSVDGSVFAFRSLTNSRLSETGTGPIEIPRKVIVNAVLSFDELNKALAKSGLNQATVTTDQLQKLISQTTYDEKYLFNADQPKTASLDNIVAESTPIPVPGLIVPKDWSSR